MTAIVDKFKRRTKNNKRLIWFLGGTFFIGLVFGSIFITVISKQDQSLIKEYIIDFMTSVSSSKLNYLDAFKNTIISNLIFILTIWMLGISVIGIPIVIFMYFTKAFMIGFSISSFILQYQWKGIIYAVVYIFPHHILNLLIYTFLMIYSIKFSLYLLDSIWKKKTIHLKHIMNRYLIVLGITVGTVIITSILETFLVPYLLRLFI